MAVTGEKGNNTPCGDKLTDISQNDKNKKNLNFTTANLEK